MNNSFESWWKEWRPTYKPQSWDSELISEMKNAEAAWDAQQKEIDRLRESNGIINNQLSKAWDEADRYKKALEKIAYPLIGMSFSRVPVKSQEDQAIARSALQLSKKEGDVK